MIRTAALAADVQDFLFGRSVGKLDSRDILQPVKRNRRSR
jgi:hypothetical protein